MAPDDLIPLPPDDPDAGLARRLAEGHHPSAADPFEGALVGFRARALRTSPPPGFANRLWARIAPAAPSLHLVPFWARWAAAAAAVLLVAFGAWLALEQGPPVLSSAGPEIAVVTLDDGSVVTLRPRSTLYRLPNHRYRLEGEAFFDVVSNPERTFRIRTDLGELRVLGTRFDVSTWGERTAVFLERGVVVFEHQTTGSVDTLAPGDELIASTTKLTVGKAQYAGATSTDWLKKTLVFGERPLLFILAEMEHHFGITVLLPDSIKSVTLSGQIELSSPGKSLSDLGTALGGRFDESRPNVFLFSVE